eukprot:Skav205048  [mRNA]  locus=scaffold2506:300470:301775:- [translate_table: standard]
MTSCHWLSLLICWALSLQTAAELFGTVKVEGTYVPKARQYASMVLYKKCLWTFGGLFPDNPVKKIPHELFGDLNCFHIDFKNWTKVAAEGSPEARVAHSGVVDFAGTMWIWGGATGDGHNAAFGDAVYSINLNEVNLDPKDGHYGAWQKVEVKGTAPPGRYMHSTVMNGTGMVIFGGLGHSREPMADVHYLDFEKKMWSEIKCQGDVPPARLGHGAAITSLGQMWVYGGRTVDASLEDLYYLKLDTRTWVKIAAQGVEESTDKMLLALSLVTRSSTLTPPCMRMPSGKKLRSFEVLLYAPQRTAPSAAIETNGRMYCYGGVVEKDGERFPDALATIAWMDTNQPTPSTATTSAHPLDPASGGGGIGVGTILVILLVVAAIVAGGLFFLRRRREMRLLQEVQEPREVELGPRA